MAAVDFRDYYRTPKVRSSEPFGLAERWAAHFDAYVLYGDTEPPGLWTVILADGSRLRAAMNEADGRYVLDAVTAPVPGLPGVRVDAGLWRLR